MGCLFSQQLMAAGCSVTLLQRSEPQSGPVTLRVEDLERVSKNYPIKLSAATAEGSVERLLVTTKAADIEPALQSMRHRLLDSTDIILAANGMGFAERVAGMLPANRLYCCTTTEAAHRITGLHIRHAGHGLTRIGSFRGGEPPPWFSDWLDAPLACQWEPDIAGALWQKLAVNCAINPLTAKHRCLNGELAKDSALQRQVERLCDEIVAVSRARGNKHTAEKVHEDVAAVIAATAANRSSMLQDVEAGRRTEVDYITGYLVSEANRLGIAVPANLSLLNEVKALAH